MRPTRFAAKHAFAIALMAFFIASLAAPVSPAQGPTGGQSLPLSPGTWVLVAAIIVLTLISIAAIVYILSGPLDSPNARGWAKSQIYEGFLVLIFISVFVAFSYLFFLDPTGALNSVGLLPNQPFFDCSQATDMFRLATCNLAIFQGFSFQLFQALFIATVYLSYTPGLKLDSGFNVPGTATGMTASSSVDSLVPVNADVTFATAFSAFLFLFLLNQLQLLLLSGALFWLAFFLSLGLIVRAFGFMRTFGGAMIAMGLGLGFVYPLVTVITYGFINVQLGSTAAIFPNNASDIAIQVFTTAFDQALSIPVPASQTYWIFPMGVALAGLTFIPFLNFTIVDAFIVDFSKAIGERLDFMSLMVGII